MVSLEFRRDLDLGGLEVGSGGCPLETPVSRGTRRDRGTIRQVKS